MSTPQISKKPGMVGQLIKDARKKAGLSQRELGLKLVPPVTTQFISNIERGITPLPLSHYPDLCAALGVAEADLRRSLELEYSASLDTHMKDIGLSTALPRSERQDSVPFSKLPNAWIEVLPEDREFMETLYETYRDGPPRLRLEFEGLCRNTLKVKTGS